MENHAGTAPAQLPRLDTSVQRQLLTPRDAAGRADPDVHGAADHHRDHARGVPDDHAVQLKEGAFALGATRWEMVRMTSCRFAPGIVGAVILGLGRALGEAIAVTQVIGNVAQIKASLFAPAGTMASWIATDIRARSTESGAVVADLSGRDPARDLADRQPRGAADHPPHGHALRCRSRHGRPERRVRHGSRGDSGQRRRKALNQLMMGLSPRSPR